MTLLDVQVGDVREARADAVAVPQSVTVQHALVLRPARAFDPDALAALYRGLVDEWGWPTTPLRIVRFWVGDDETRDAYVAAIGGASRRLRPTRWEDAPFRLSDEEPTSDTRPVPFRREIDEDDLTLVRAGLPALQMEEKWWAAYTGDRLRILRSWTGYEIYSLRVRPRPDGAPGAILDQLHVCDDPERYTGDDADALGWLEAVLRMILRRT